MSWKVTISMLDVDGEEIGEDDNAAVNQSTEDLSEHSSEWISPGWMAYPLLGPSVNPDFRSPLFSFVGS
jgi:hypothetical protein